MGGSSEQRLFKMWVQFHKIKVVNRRERLKKIKRLIKAENVDYYFFKFHVGWVFLFYFCFILFKRNCIRFAVILWWCTEAVFNCFINLEGC